ncbi:MAG: hypothetical protein Fur0015_03000 [Ignavibacteriales bacterium]
MNAEFEISGLKQILSEVLMDLNSLTFENFDIKFKEAKTKMILANEIKKQLQDTFSKDELKKNEKELLILAKLIKESYDNTIQKIKEEQNRVSNQLKSVRNMKKIAIYEVGK